jgi:hypothetical protein
MYEQLSAPLEQPAWEELEVARQQSVADVHETGAPTGNADGASPVGKRGWL